MLGGVRSIISQPSPSKLNEVMKIEELMGRTPEEISDIWLQVRRGRGEQRGTQALLVQLPSPLVTLACWAEPASARHNSRDGRCPTLTTLTTRLP